MSEFLMQHYQILRAGHIIAVIAWMAGLLYLPRLFAYHADAQKGSELSETLKVMEARLLRIIMNPAMGAAWVFGLCMMAANPALMQHGWIHVKLMAVVLMSVLHMVFARWRKTFANDANVRPAKFYKIWNEVPAVLMIIIVIMAVVEPF